MHQGVFADAPAASSVACQVARHQVGDGSMASVEGTIGWFGHAPLGLAVGGSVRAVAIYVGHVDSFHVGTIVLDLVATKAAVSRSCLRGRECGIQGVGVVVPEAKQEEVLEGVPGEDAQISVVPFVGRVKQVR